MFVIIYKIVEICVITYNYVNFVLELYNTWHEGANVKHVMKLVMIHFFCKHKTLFLSLVFL
jgi:hypothetical protein